MCNLELNEVRASTNYMKSLGLVRLADDQVNVTDVCLRLMLGKLFKSKHRLWVVVRCREGYEDLLKSMGFMGRGTILFAPLMRLMIDEISEHCDVILACTSKKLSELWRLKVGSLTPWSSFSSSIEARNRALNYLRSKRRDFAYAVETSVKKLVEAFVIARNLSSVFDLSSSSEVLKEEMGIDLSYLFKRKAIEDDPLKAFSILDEGIERCRRYLEEHMGARASHPRFEEVEGFEFSLEA